MSMRSDSRWKIRQWGSLLYFSSQGLDLWWRKGDKTRMSSGIKHIRSHALCRCWAHSWLLVDLSGFDLKQAFMKIPAGDRAVRHLSSLPGVCLISPCGMKESECTLRLFPQVNLTVPDAYEGLLGHQLDLRKGPGPALCSVVCSVTFTAQNTRRNRARPWNTTGKRSQMKMWEITQPVREPSPTQGSFI